MSKIRWCRETLEKQTFKSKNSNQILKMSGYCLFLGLFYGISLRISSALVALRICCHIWQLTGFFWLCHSHDFQVHCPLWYLAFNLEDIPVHVEYLPLLNICKTETQVMLLKCYYSKFSDFSSPWIVLPRFPITIALILYGVTLHFKGSSQPSSVAVGP